jgi:FeS assembly SUF system protein
MEKPVILGTQRLAQASGEEKGPMNPDSPQEKADSSSEAEGLEPQIIAALKTCFDPEIPVNIYELGLIYSLNVTAEGNVQIRMTLTSPACPVAGSLVQEVENKTRAVPGVTNAQVELVWDPPWDQTRMSEAAQLQLGLF